MDTRRSIDKHLACDVKFKNDSKLDFFRLSGEHNMEENIKGIEAKFRIHKTYNELNRRNSTKMMLETRETKVI